MGTWLIGNAFPHLFITILLLLLLKRKQFPSLFIHFPVVFVPLFRFLRLPPWASVALKYYFDIPLAPIIMPGRIQRKSVRLNLVAFRPDANSGLCPKCSSHFPRLHCQSILYIRGFTHITEVFNGYAEWEEEGTAAGAFCSAWSYPQFVSSKASNEPELSSKVK